MTVYAGISEPSFTVDSIIIIMSLGLTSTWAIHDLKNQEMKTTNLYFPRLKLSGSTLRKDSQTRYDKK